MLVFVLPTPAAVAPAQLSSVESYGSGFPLVPSAIEFPKSRCVVEDIISIEAAAAASETCSVSYSNFAEKLSRRVRVALPVRFVFVLRIEIELARLARYRFG